MCVLSIKVPIGKKCGNLLYAPRISKNSSELYLWEIGFSYVLLCFLISVLYSQWQFNVCKIYVPLHIKIQMEKRMKWLFYSWHIERQKEKSDVVEEALSHFSEWRPDICQGALLKSIKMKEAIVISFSVRCNSMAASHLLFDQQ